ncbi:hypothetical protein JYU04_03150, partial [Dehalococcoides mccartyi]|nr:hypothetical protein [Dehalococcoides mccartyi]
MSAVLVVIGLSAYGVSTKSSPSIKVEKVDQIFVISEISPGSEVWYADGRVGHFITKINDQPAAEFDNFPKVVNSLHITPSLDAISVRTAIGVGTNALIQQSISLLLLSITFAVMSLFVFTRADRTHEVILFAYFSASAAATLAIGPASLANHSWARLVQGTTTSVTSVYFLAFFLGFARDSLSRYRIPSARIPELSTGLVAVLIGLWILTATSWPDLFPALRSTALLLLGLSLLGVFILLPLRYRRAAASRKEQLRIATAGTILGIFPFVWLSIIPQIVTGEPLIAAEATVLGLALIPLSFGYSILRYQLLGISRLVHRSATYILITAAIIAVYGSLLTILNRFADDTELLRNIELILLFLMFAGVPLISGVRNRAVR